MYRNCIFCSADLGSNDSVERFPVGGTLAFDGDKGRLWTVCRRCARWNLAPLEERWEAIEDAERLFRDTSLRAQTENIGVAKLRDGTRLIRVGQALPGEVAAWRYGDAFARRRYATIAAGLGGVLGAGLLTGAAGFVAASAILSWGSLALEARTERRIVARTGGDAALADASRPLRWHRIKFARVEAAPDGDGLGVRIPPYRLRWTAPFRKPAEESDLLVRGAAAVRLLTRAMPVVNATGARPRTVESAARLLQAVSAGDYVRVSAAAGFPLAPTRRAPVERLAFEMALNEESERRAMDGELAALEAMWREAEQIAAIADRLPDVPASDPPRLHP